MEPPMRNQIISAIRNIFELKKSLLFCALTIIICTQQVHAEYIIFKCENTQKPQPLTYDEHKRVYTQVLMRYQWPMCIANKENEWPTFVEEKENKNTYENYKQKVKEITSFSLPNTGPAEEETIRKKIKEINPYFDVIFIPTTFYELITLRHIKELMAPLNAINQYMNDELDQIEGNITYIMNNSKKKSFSIWDIYEQFSQVNYLDHNIKLHWNINQLFFRDNLIGQLTTQTSTTAFINFLVTKSPNLHEIDTSLQNCDDYSPKYSSDNDYEEQESSQKDKQKRTLNLENIYALEVNAHKNNFGVMYRGLKTPKQVLPLLGKSIKPLERPILYKDEFKDNKIFENATQYEELVKLARTNTLTHDQKERLKILESNSKHAFDLVNPSRSVSYSHSLFAGYLTKERGTCAYDYFTKSKESIGYAVLVNKYLYLKGDLQKIFRITPITTLPSLTLDNFLYHPRTIMYSENKSSFLTGMDSECVPVSGDITNYLRIKECPLKSGLAFSEYITDHACILSLSESDGGCNPHNHKINALFNGQRQMNALLKILISLKKRYPQFATDNVTSDTENEHTTSEDTASSENESTTPKENTPSESETDYSHSRKRKRQSDSDEEDLLRPSRGGLRLPGASITPHNSDSE